MSRKTDSRNILISFFVAIFGFALLAGCSLPKEPKVSFGKKCSETQDGQVVYSYVWVYDKSAGLKASKKTCLKQELETLAKADKVKSKN